MKQFIATGTSHANLAYLISQKSSIPICKQTIKAFKNSEIGVTIHDNIRNCDIFLVQTGWNDKENNKSINDFIMETLILVDAYKRSAAKSITLISEEAMKSVWQDRIPDEELEAAGFNRNEPWMFFNPEITDLKEQEAQQAKQREFAEQWLANEAYEQNAVQDGIYKVISQKEKERVETPKGPAFSPRENINMASEVFSNPEANGNKLVGKRYNGKIVDQVNYNPETGTLDLYSVSTEINTQEFVKNENGELVKDENGETIPVTKEVATVIESIDIPLDGNYNIDAETAFAEELQRAEFGNSAANLETLNAIKAYYPNFVTQKRNNMANISKAQQWNDHKGNYDGTALKTINDMTTKNNPEIVAKYQAMINKIPDGEKNPEYNTLLNQALIQSGWFDALFSSSALYDKEMAEKNKPNENAVQEAAGWRKDQTYRCHLLPHP